MRISLDRGIILAVLFLIGLGLVQVYSSSFIFAIESYDDGLFFFKKQLFFACVGILVLILTAMVPTKYLVQIGAALWVVGLLGVVLTFIPGFGVKVGGAARWLNIGGGFRLEPSEIVKYSTPFIAAYVYFKETTLWSIWKKSLFYLIPFIPLVILIKQPDFGSVAIIGVVLFGILFSFGLQWSYVIAGFLGLSGAAYYLIMNARYRLDRITAFLDPWADPAHKGFQIIQSMLGFYSGGLTGAGIGQGQGKLYFLPEAHTDFTMSVLGEELGFIGVTIVLSVFGFLVLRGLQIAVRAKDPRHQMMALGITLILGLTTIINAGVAMGLLPTKGLGMPFLSYGGSALIVTCASLGVILNIDRYARTKVSVEKKNYKVPS